MAGKNVSEEGCSLNEKSKLRDDVGRYTSKWWMLVKITYGL